MRLLNDSHIVVHTLHTLHRQQANFRKVSKIIKVLLKAQVVLSEEE